MRPSPLASCGLLLTSLTLYHTSGDLSRGLLKKIATFFQRAVSYTVWAWLRHTDFSVLYPNGAGSTRPVPHPLDTNSIPHLFPDCNRQNAQNRDFYFLDICAAFLLTKLARHGIMEISARAHVGGPTKTATLFTAEAQGWRELISNFNFNFWGGKPPLLPFHKCPPNNCRGGKDRRAEHHRRLASIIKSIYKS